MTDDTTSAVREAISAHFHALRHDPAHHLGLGDIRLTMGQQEEILEMLTTPPEAEAGAETIDIEGAIARLHNGISEDVRDRVEELERTLTASLESGARAFTPSGACRVCGTQLSERPVHAPSDAPTPAPEVGEPCTECEAVSAAIGTVRWMDPPDGGDVTLAEQVRRMREHIERHEAQPGTDALRHVSSELDLWLCSCGAKAGVHPHQSIRCSANPCGMFRAALDAGEGQP